jgi:tetratricopeptide (TPR) repeat protein
MNRGILWAWVGILSSGAAAFALSCHLSPMTASAGRDPADFSVAGRIFGASRAAFAGFLHEKADKDFHLGRDARHKESFHDSIFQRIGDGISPKDHVHLSGPMTKEMLAWIRMSLLVDPHNIQSYLLASYWLSSPEINRPDQAREVLLDGQAGNPRSHEIQMELAILDLRQGNLDAAKRFLDTGLALWPGTRDPAAERALLEKEKELLLTYRALLHENDTQIPQAIHAWREVLKIFPDRSDVRDRLQVLESGKEPPMRASERWKKLLRASEDERGACHREDHVPDPRDAPGADMVKPLIPTNAVPGNLSNQRVEIPASNR